MSDKESNLLEGLLLGGLIGLAIGLLVAPAAGEKTRSLVKAKLADFDLGDVVERFSTAFEAGLEEAERAKKEVEM